MTIVRVGYKSGVRFDEQYYLTKHIPMANGVMAPFGIKGVEIMRVTASPAGTPVYRMMFSAKFESMDAAMAALQSPEFGQVLADVPNYYDGTPDVMIGESVE